VQFVIRDLSKHYPNRTQPFKDVSLDVPQGMSGLLEPEMYPGIRTDSERSFSAPRRLPADLFLGRPRANSA